MTCHSVKFPGFKCSPASNDLPFTIAKGQEVVIYIEFGSAGTCIATTLQAPSSVEEFPIN